MRRVFLRRDHSRGVGWDNRRGVIAAIEQYLGRVFDETQDFTTMCGEWIVKHYANCNGLTVLERWGGEGAAPSAEAEAVVEPLSWISSGSRGVA